MVALWIKCNKQGSRLMNANLFNFEKTLGSQGQTRCLGATQENMRWHNKIRVTLNQKSTIHQPIRAV